MKKIVLLAVVFFVALCGCDRPPDKPAVAFTQPSYRWGTVSGRTITVWGNRGDLKRPYMRKAFARYETLTGNRLRIEGYSHGELAEKLPAAFMAGTENCPDVLLSFGGVTIENLNPDENFYDFTHAPWVDDLTDTAVNQAIVHGRVIGLPYWEASVSGILYNRELFRAHGLSLPRTQKEFLDVCEVLLQKNITPVYLPFAEPTMLLYQFPMDAVVEEDAVLLALNEGGLSYADIPAMRTIVSWYRLMAERGYFGRDYERNDWAGMDTAMRAGTHAMMLCWDTWLYTDFTGNPDQFGLMPAFMGVPDQGTYEGPNLALLLVNRHSPQLDAALDLIAFIADPYNYNVTLAGIRTAPVFKNQIGSVSTPQYAEAELRIEKLFHDSTAWLRVRGFSQLDAVYIQRHMRDPAYDVETCLNDMDAARRARMGRSAPN